MKLRRELLGIILAFTAAGTIATNADSTAYQEIYAQQDKQEKQIHVALESEFISQKDTALLEKSMQQIEEAEQKATKRSLKAMLEQEEQDLADVQKRLADKEEKVAATEYKQLAKELEALAEKRQEPFIVKEDTEQLAVFQESLTDLEDAQKVDAIRTLASEIDALAKAMDDNQKKLVALTNTLKEANTTNEALTKAKYLSTSDKDELKTDREENTKYLKDADNLEQVTTRKTESVALIDRLEKKNKDSEQDFKDNEKSAKELVQATNTLLSEGDLTSDEEKELKSTSETLNKSLKLEVYVPGDLAKHSTSLQTIYDEYLENSDKRIAEAKKKAEQEAAEKAAREKEEAAKQQALAEEQARNSASNAASSSSAPTLVGEWYQAPAGYKFLKVESGKTYGQVKNPGNFSLITEAEAANYSPGHGNGSAKQ